LLTNLAASFSVSSSSACVHSSQFLHIIAVLQQLFRLYRVITNRQVPTKVRRITLAVANFGGCPQPGIERQTQINWGCPVLVSAGSFSSIVVILIKQGTNMKQSLYCTPYSPSQNHPNA
jgi:hypothetical protein